MRARADERARGMAESDGARKSHGSALGRSIVCMCVYVGGVRMGIFVPDGRVMGRLKRAHALDGEALLLNAGSEGG